MISDADFQTLVVTAGSLLTAIVSALIARGAIKRRRRRRGRDVDAGEREAVESYTNDPGRFVHDILESNRQYAAQVKEYAKEVAGLRKELADDRLNEKLFRNALARWMIRILDRFAEHNVDMPYPDPMDADILSEVIPSALEGTRPRPPRPKTS